ncbi:MAG: vWA domain-containing protein [Aestuariivirgaceae bacterium]
MHKTLSHVVLVVIAILLSGVSARAADENVMIVLDASGSMWGHIDGTPKIDIARHVMGQVLADLDGKANIGVLTYGHRTKGDCGDIETIIPVGKVDRGKYMAAISGLSPKGKTPITAAVRKGAEQLRYTEEKATLVLVSDGLETCQADPCAVARELESQGIDFTVHVIGFDLKDKDTSSLQCLAKETGGTYFSADDADELGEAFDTVVVQAPKPEPAPEPANTATLLKVEVVFSEGSQPFDKAYVYVVPAAANKDKSKAAKAGHARYPYELEPGRYYLETKVGSAVGSVEVDVEANRETVAQIILNAGLLSVKVVPDEGGKPIKQAYVYVDELAPQVDGKRKNVTAGNQRKVFTLPAGKYFVTADHGQARVGQEVEVAAGRKTDTTIVLASGLLQVSVLAEEGGKPQKDGYVSIYENQLQTDGTRKQVTAGNQRRKFSLPAGNYFVTAKIGKAAVGREIQVVAGKLNEASIVVGVGALKASAVPAEGAKPLDKAYISIFELEKALDGSRKRLATGTQRKTFKLPAGTYQVVAKIDSAAVAQDITVKAGKLTEATINLNAGALSVDAGKKVYVTVYSVEKNLDGTRDKITAFHTGKPVMLPAGRYVLSGKDGQKVSEAEVEIKAGKLTELKFEP